MTNVGTDNDVLSPSDSGRHISDHARHVQLDSDGIEKCAEALAERLSSAKLSLNDLFVKTSVHPQKANEKGVEWIFFADALNFSFWNNEDQPQYLVTYKEERYTGYLAFCAAINRSVDKGVDLTNPEFFKDVTEEKLNDLLMGDNNVPCPMIKERLKVLHDVAEVLLSTFDGSFVNCVKSCKGNAQALVQLVVDHFPCFRDGATFAGRRVLILKRAQILVADVWALFEGKGLGEFADIDTITMFADYRVPQSLQYFGALLYSDELMGVLAKNDLLANGSEYEVEIRGCSIEAVSRVVEVAQKKLPHFPINCILADYFLWGFRREKADEMVKYPYHKTRSVYY